MFKKTLIALVVVGLTFYFWYLKELDRRDLTPVIPGLYISNLASSEDSKLLRQNGITRVISVIQQKKSEETRDMYERLKIDNWEFNLPDRPNAPIFLLFNKVQRLIHDEIQAGGRVLVHCRAGVSRSATLIIMYLMRTLDLGFPEALSKLQKKRPIVNPNPGFREQLRRYA